MKSIFETEDGQRVVTQAPNPPIVAAFSAWLISALSDGDISRVAGNASRFLLLYWAWLEITRGVNTWRRMLGVLVAALTLITVFSELDF